METTQGPIKLITYLGVVNQDRLLLVKYKTPPNPRRTGTWWIPAPELEYGEDPKQKAEKIATEWTLKSSCTLLGIESFVSPGGWHLIYQFKLNTGAEKIRDPNIESVCWVTKEELASMDDLAHGDWEKEMGFSFLMSNAD